MANGWNPTPVPVIKESVSYPTDRGHGSGGKCYRVGLRPTCDSCKEYERLKRQRLRGKAKENEERAEYLSASSAQDRALAKAESEANDNYWDLVPYGVV